MTQYASPNSDVLDGAWTNAGGGQGALNSNVRKGTGDGSYIISEVAMGFDPDLCKFGLQNPDDPNSDADHIVRYRAIAAGMFGPAPDLIIALYQGSSGVRSVTNGSVSTSALTDYSFTLTTAEAASIGDYDALQLWITRGAGNMGDSMKLSEAYFECPDPSAPAAAAPATVNPEAFLMFLD
tara:strand:- start:1881 stop:2423 length:543 start_codon:yes stop_codon:yes gene_type:complete